MAPDEPATEETEHVAVDVPPGRELTGRTLGKFTVVEKLGKGGSGDVFRAEQVQLGRSVVVKVLRQEVTWTPNRVERFLREARLASRLDHPYAAHVYAFGAEPDGVLWIAMEHVKGTTLDELIARRGAMPTRAFAPLFVRLCEVVHTAHELGIVHRDLKGSNVMVIERAGQLLPKLLDFGIAKGEHGDVAPGLDGHNALTGHGVTLGSPQYMSPEQWQHPSDVDGRSDVYGLGVLAYRCVCGHLPFQSLDRKELAKAHVHEPPPPLPELVPAPVCDAIYRAMAKDVRARWQTAVELGEAIRIAANTAAPEVVPIFDPNTRDAWLRAGPQPIADVIGQLAGASTTVEADAAIRELVAIACRWLAVLALAGVPEAERAAAVDPVLRQRARDIVGRDDAAPWLALARAASAASTSPLPGLVAALAESGTLARLADRLDDRMRVRTAAALDSDIAATAEALGLLEPLLAYQLVVARADGSAESWQGPRRRERERVVVWGLADGADQRPLADGEVVLLDGGNRVVARLSPLAQVIAPLPSAEPELFLLWRTRRGTARLVAAPWGFERDDDAAGMRLAALTTEDSSTQFEADDARSPYPGLASYRSDDADRFVGREREIESLANRLIRTPLIAVLGPSGVGKSSFLHAGLVPRLGEQHHLITLRPGRHPLYALAAAVGMRGDGTPDEATLAAKLHELGERAPRGLVVVVDQLEELVTLCADRDERRAFASVLARAADDQRAPVRVVATLRDDFATVTEGETAFRGRFEVFVLGTPPRDALRRIVTEPARRSNVTIDPRVVEDMVIEVAGRPASLPLLSFTAAQLWRTRERDARSIAYDTYVAIGGVAGALATYADEIYASLPRHERDIVRDLFARLVAADGTRVPWPRRELEDVPGLSNVLAHLVDARLLVVRDDEGTDVVEIVHECLAERWPRLARWRSEDAADRALLDDVRVAARRWQEAGRPPDLLWRGMPLTQLRTLAARSTALTEVERAFADAARAAQLRARRIRRGIVAAAMVVLASVAGVMAYLGAVANRNRTDAVHNAVQARDAAKLAEDRLTESLVTQGRRELNDGRSIHALAFFGEAMRRGVDTTALRTMISFASRGWRDMLATPHFIQTGIPTTSLAGWFAIGDRVGHVHWLDDSGKSIADVAANIGEIHSVEMAPGDGVVVLGDDGVVQFDAHHVPIAHLELKKNSADGALAGPGRDEVTLIHEHRVEIYGYDGERRRSTPIAAPPGPELPQVDASGRYLFVGNQGYIGVIDRITMQTRAISRDSDGPPSVSDDGSTIGYIDRPTRAIHLLRANGDEEQLIPTTIFARTLVISPTGDRIAAASPSQLQVFDRGGHEIKTYPIISAQEPVILVRGNDAWVTGSEEVVRHYVDGELIASIPMVAANVYGLMLAGNAVGALGSDSSVAFVRADARQKTFDPLPCHPDPTFFPASKLMLYDCPPVARAFVGRRFAGEVPPIEDYVYSDVDDNDARTIISTHDGTGLYDRQGKRVAFARDLYGPVALEDDAHAIVVNKDHVLRWTFAGNGRNELLTGKDIYAALHLAPRTLLLGDQSGQVTVIVDGHETRRLTFSDRVVGLTRSPDQRWVAVELSKGTTAIVDTSTYQVVRMLDAVDPATPVFDSTGELMLRLSHNTESIWDRRSGENLMFGVDLFQGTFTGRFLPDGRLELDAYTPTFLDIPRDTRPAAAILADIACRVPLHVVGSHLEPAPVTCP